jgi:hypothetical protein
MQKALKAGLKAGFCTIVATLFSGKIAANI